MANKLQDSAVSDHLNLIRGLAAIAVLVYHVRYRFFYDYADLIDPTIGQRAFYTLTAFGHDAVMVFFVLSGYFISSSVIRDCEAGRWSWRKYLTNRFVRLYVVLLPGVLLTVFWDKLGLHFFGNNPIYTGEPRPWRHDFVSISDRLTWPTIVGNLCFVQSILVTPLGSNDPLWSLSFEFWYYLLFPCGWLALFGKSVSWLKRAMYLALCVLGLFFVGKTIALYFPIWLLGLVGVVLPRIPFLARRPMLPTLIAGAVFGSVLLLTHLSAFKAALGGTIVRVDYLIGVSFVLFLYQLLHNNAPSAGGAYAGFARAIAGFSYTLYVAHMPLLVFLRAFLVPDEPWTPDLVHMGAAVLLTLIALGYALVLARMTEARTDGVRDWIQQCLRPGAFAAVK